MRTLQDVQTLSRAQKTALKRSNFKDVSDVVLTPPSEIAKKLKTSLNEAQSIVEIVSKEIARTFVRLQNLEECSGDKFTTGDAVLDRVIGGGIRTSMIWELVGESASGKTQLALQLCLLVQLRPMLGGLSGSACYLSTHAQLSTKRLNQLITVHHLLSPSVCSLSDIHTVTVPTIELLVRALTVTFPALQDDLRKDFVRQPVRLIVIDSISALFHGSGKASGSTLFERSRALSELSRVIHEIATRDNIAFIIVNEVTDSFNDYYFDSQEGVSKDDILYRDQARWFNSAHSIPVESAKEACLGLVWANQVNARIMLTRTNRRKHLDDDPYPLAKRRQVDVGVAADGQSSTPAGSEDFFGQDMLLRRFSVIFSAVSAPGSVDFVVTNAGITARQDGVVNTSVTPGDVDNYREGHRNIENGHVRTLKVPDSNDASDGQTKHQFVNARLVSTATEGQFSETGADTSLDVIPNTYPEVDDFDDDARHWEEFDDIHQDVLLEVDFDGLEKSQIEEEDLRPSRIVAAAVENG